MATGDFEANRRLTFGQAEGLEPLPRQLDKTEMPRKLRARLWLLFEGVIDSYRSNSHRGYYVLDDEGLYVLREYYVTVLHDFGDNLPNRFNDVKLALSATFRQGDYKDIFNFVQFMIRIYGGRNSEINRVGSILEEELCAYRLIDGHTLVAVSSSEEAETIQEAVTLTSAHNARGSHAHIRNAIDLLNTGDFSGSVRESISSVESLSKVLANEPKAELSKALQRLERSTNIHGGMKAAFNSLYGYTSDEKGVRHSLLFKDKADVDEADALFMIGACSAFLSYLIRKANDAGISVDSVE